MIRRVLIPVVCLAAALVAAAADEPKPIPCTLTVSPRPGMSEVSGGHSNMLRANTIGGNTGSKTIKRNMKWLAEVRFRETRPEKAELRAYYIGQNADGKLILLGKDAKGVELDKNGRASVEFTSPTTQLTKSRTRSTSGGHHGFSSVKTQTRGERVTGCVVQLFADGQMAKSWTSDSRWAAEAAKPAFSIAELEKKKSAIGLR